MKSVSVCVVALPNELSVCVVALPNELSVCVGRAQEGELGQRVVACMQTPVIWLCTTNSSWWVAVGTAVVWLCTINHHGGWLWVLALYYKSLWWVAVGVGSVL